jgi:hypothetical protein
MKTGLKRVETGLKGTQKYIIKIHKKNTNIFVYIIEM